MQKPNRFNLKKTLFAGLVVFVSFSNSLAAQSANSCHFSRILPSFKGVDFDPRMGIKIESIHPQLETNATLFRRGANGKIINELAKSYSVNEQSKVMSISLDQSCHWSDGEPIFAKDVVAGIQLLFSEKAKNNYLPGREMLLNSAEIIANEKEVESLGIREAGDFEVEIDLVTPPELLLQGLTFSMMTPMPLHLVKKDPDAWPVPGIVRVSSGAFVATSQSDSEITLERNKHYCHGLKSNIQSISLKGVSGRRNTALALLNGAVDIAEEVSREHLDVMLAKGEEFTSKFEVINTEEDIMAYLVIGKHNKELLNDPEIREAIWLSINRDYLHEEIGSGGVHSKLFNSVSFDYDGYVPAELDKRFNAPFKQRQAAAREILRKRGFDKNNPYKLTFAVRPSSPYEQAGLAIASMLNAANFEVDLQLGVSLVSERVFRDLALNAWGADFADPVNTIQGVAITLSGDWDSKTQATNHIINKSERFAALREISEGILASGLYLPLFEITSPWVISKDITLLDENYAIGRNMYRKSCEAPS